MSLRASYLTAECDSCGESWDSGFAVKDREAAERHARRHGHRVRVERVQVYDYDYTQRATAASDNPETGEPT